MRAGRVTAVSWSRGTWTSRGLITTAPWCPTEPWLWARLISTGHFPSLRGECSVVTFKWLAGPCLKSQLIKAKLPSMVQRSGGSDEASADWALLAGQGSSLCIYHHYLPQALSYRAFFSGGNPRRPDVNVLNYTTSPCLPQWGVSSLPANSFVTLCL